MKAYKSGSTYSLHKETTSSTSTTTRTVISVSQASAVTKTVTLGAGTEGWIEIVGSGGAGTAGDVGWTVSGASGGSGGRFSCNFVLSADTTFALTLGAQSSGGDGNASTLSINGTLVATAGGGTRGVAYYGPVGVGGTTTSNTSVSGITFSNVSNVNGNDGTKFDGGDWGSTAQGGASVATSGTYGKGGNGNRNNTTINGDVGIIYLSVTKEIVTTTTWKAFNV